MSRRTQKTEELLRQEVGTYIQKISDGSPLITVTRVDISPDLKQATIYISVLPEEKETEALKLVKRHLSDLRNQVGQMLEAKNTPFFSLELDRGDKKRRRIEKLLDSQ